MPLLEAGKQQLWPSNRGICLATGAGGGACWNPVEWLRERQTAKRLSGSCQAEVSGQKEKPDPQRPGEKRGRQRRNRGSLSGNATNPNWKKPGAFSRDH